jgi:serine/threonine-protein phosphatase 5
MTSTPPANVELPNDVLELKNKGNDALMAGHPLDAIGFYSEALDLLGEENPNAIILSNRAQAYIKVENYGLAIADATLAIKTDPTYPKAYYRRGTAEFALNKPKQARKDFKMVCKLRPKDKDARMRYAECEKMVKEAAFAAAIQSAQTAPLSDSYEPNDIVINSGYDGPHPSGGDTCLSMDDFEKEDALFEPGNLPLDFVMVRDKWFKTLFFNYFIFMMNASMVPHIFHVACCTYTL